MEPLDNPEVQKQLIRCQEILDAARQSQWTPELVRAFDEATRELHEGAILRKLSLPSAIGVPRPELSSTTAVADDSPPPSAPEAEEVSVPERPTNRLLSPEERGEEPAPAEETQVDLLSSIGEMTLAEKLALQPLNSVADGLSIVERAQFTSVLFSGEEEVFSGLLNKLARAATQEEAFALFQEAMNPKGEDGEVEFLQEAFAKRIMRTFVS